jgi:hypothetical protein
MQVQRKSFGVALLLWLFFGSIGAHKMYVKERVHYIFWYWLASICTLSIILWIDLFRMKGMIDRQYFEDKGKYAA